jgi:hypothetical protein
VQQIQPNGQLKVLVLRNGKPVVAEVHISSGDLHVESGSTTTDREQPRTFTLEPGRYEVAVRDPENTEMEPILPDPVTIEGGVSVEVQVDLCQGSFVRSLIANYDQYLRLKHHKAAAFAVQEDGCYAWGFSSDWTDSMSAENRAIQQCNKSKSKRHIEAACELKLLDDEVISDEFRRVLDEVFMRSRTK